MGDLPDSVMAASKIHSDCDKRGKGGHDFTEKCSSDGDYGGNRTSFRKKDDLQNIAASNSCNLFQKLYAGRQGSLFPGIIITVDA